MQTFGERLRKIRREQFIRQKQLADHLNIAVSTLSQYENDKRHPNFEILSQISQYFGVTTDYLLGLDESENHDMSKSIDVIDEQLADRSYQELLHKITNNLVTMSKHNDTKSLRIFHTLYDSINSISAEYQPADHESIEDMLTNHLAHKEDIDQTLNQLFRHHIKISSEQTF
ncbi:helix-turn-helix domain-containing protein [Acidaminobacter sp. JC074]|uniref:helix-turn-helix domain-containing protein n=1 Tax=Acidaminobacter sp. JC074 TaxID=2530199 RepID=UPI001F0F5B21|nr:helix-turn-helix domain-containing protein [Acidaminobacter sp. JC074]MCH4890770.1 helix-turn-helix domain-containing protein [Acidaminobacter sp. JC074]